MKKTVVLILIFLPIVLLLVIAIAGRVLSTYQRIDVESVVFTNDLGEELDSSATLMVSCGETKPTKIRIYPELATDKRVSYTSTNTEICTVDSEGAVTGIKSGSAIIMVKTADGDKTAMLSVTVYAGSVTGVNLTPETLSMMIGDSADLEASVEPFGVSNKNVFFTTSDPSVVSVSATGKLKAVGAGVAVITVTTQDGGFTDTCTVTVVDDIPPLYFDFTGVAGMQQTGTGYITSQKTVDLTAGLRFDDEIDPEKIEFRITQGNGATVDENGLLTFNYQSVVVIEAFFTDAESNLTCRAELRIAWFE